MTTTDYTPQPGDKVHVTLRATYCSSGYDFENGGRVSDISPLIVSVVHAPLDLPSAFGAVIRAEGVRFDGVVTLMLGDPGSSAPWRHLDDALRWERNEDITRVVEIVHPGVEL